MLSRELLAMSPEEFASSFLGSPMKRAKCMGLKRNAAVVLGNVDNPSDVTALVAALADRVARQAARRVGARV